MFMVAADPTVQQNGDLAIRSDKGRLVALVYAMGMESDTKRYAQVIAAALNAAFSPSHTDMMVTPDQLDTWLEANPLSDGHAEGR